MHRLPSGSRRLVVDTVDSSCDGASNVRILFEELLYINAKRLLYNLRELALLVVQQRLWRGILEHIARLENENLIVIQNGIDAVRNGQHRLLRKLFADRLLNQ